jgi:hypothetical protein
VPVRSTQSALGLALYSPKLPVVGGVGTTIALIARQLERAFKVLLQIERWRSCTERRFPAGPRQSLQTALPGRS